MRPQEVLDHQAALIDFLDSRYYRSYLDNFTADMVRKNELFKQASGDAVVEVERSSLQVAQAFHVQRDMMPLLRAASLDLDGNDHLVHERLPAEHGFLMFDEPWQTSDVWGEQMTVHALHWRHAAAGTENGRVIPGVWLTHYTSLYDPEDQTTQRLIERHGIEALQRLGTYHVSHIGFRPYGQRVGPISQPGPQEYMVFAEEGQQVVEEMPNDARMVVALFRLLGQVIVEMADAPVDRALRRRMEHKRLPPRVTTIKLRRKEKVGFAGPEEFQGVLQHRFPVRGTWQWRKCGPNHPLAEPYEKGYHARVYIGPYWKGPEGAPIRISQKVWDLAR